MVWILIAKWVLHNPHSIGIRSAKLLLLSHTYPWHAHSRHCARKLLLVHLRLMLLGGVSVHSCHNLSQLANDVVWFLLILLVHLLRDLLLCLNWPLLLLHHWRHLLHLRLLGLLNCFWGGHKIKKISLGRLRHGLSHRDIRHYCVNMRWVE